MRSRNGHEQAKTSIAANFSGTNGDVAGQSRSSVHFSSKTDEWPTPQWLFDALDREFGFTLDPCSTDANAKCPRHFTRAEDGLRQSWAGETVFMNPPYGEQIGRWMAKAHHAAVEERATVVCLVPARTDTKWWHAFAMKHEIRLLRGRLRFGEASASAPFPSAVVVMRPSSFRLRAFDPEQR
ncbi:MAG: DNA N-6-adenine-methyltransferase [Limisphaerales bacterium]